MENVPVEQWAQALWRYAHVMASALPVRVLTDALKQASVAFVYAQCHLIPCETCRDHYNTFVKAQPPTFNSGEDVQRWWLQCHNYTNRLLGKPEWSITQLKQTYPPNGMYPDSSGVGVGGVGLNRLGAQQSNTITSLPTLPQYQMVQYKKPERMIGVNQHIPMPRTALPGIAPKGAQWTKPKQAPSLQFQTKQKTYGVNGTYMTPSKKPVTYGQSLLYNRQHQLNGNRNTLSYQTQQWRALTKIKTGAVKKKKCSSCSKRKAP